MGMKKAPSFSGNWMFYAYLLLPALMLFLASAFRFEYGYYQILRPVVFASAIFFAFISGQEFYAIPLTVLTIIAVIFNPLIPVHLSRDTWVVIDLISGACFAAYFLFFAVMSKISTRETS